MRLFSIELPSSVAAIVSLLLAVGCSSSNDVREEMVMTKACLQTKCDKLQHAADGYCGECLSACSGASYDCDPSSACESSCGEHEVYCSDADRTDCAKTGFRAELPENANSELEAACNRARTHVESCGVSSISADDCRLMGKVERGDRAATYDCYATTPCDAGFAKCDPTPTTLGDELCIERDGCSPFCDTKLKTALDAEGAWLRADVQKAAKDCVALPSCSDAHDCLAAWVAATLL